MGIFGLTGFKSTLGTALAVTLTSLLAWAFASSAASIEWLGIEPVETPIIATSQPHAANQGDYV
jgi:hypothetical protein